MRRQDSELRSFLGNGAFRPLRRVWVFTWLILCAIWAVKLALELLAP